MHRHLALSVATIAACLGGFACSSSDGGDPAAAEGAGGTENEVTPTPGTLPCDLPPSGFEGDSQCILPPDPELGLQLYMGPGPENYDNPDVINAVGEDGKPIWLMYPGDERTQSYHVYSPNTETIYYFEQHYRMRPGSHHMILMASDDKTSPEGFTTVFGNIIASLGGTQHITEDLPPGGVVPEEDQGLGRKMDPGSALDAQLHFYNTTDEVRLREAWVNFMYKPKEEVKSNLGMLGGFIIPMNIPPNSKKSVSNVCKYEQFIGQNEQPIGRIVTLFGHAHTHNTRFAVWHDKADGSEELVYDSYEGADAPTFTYNTQVQNPVADPDARKTGARSGMLKLEPGEQLRYQCDITNDTEFTFTGRNEVNTDEMCNLFGSVQGLGFPCFSLTRAAATAAANP